MTMVNRIKQTIKAEIEGRLIGTDLPYSNLRRRLNRIVRWWEPGFRFNPQFDLASIPVIGPFSTEVEFTFWGLLEQPDASYRQQSVTGHFGPVTISFGNGSYNVNCDQAGFSFFEIE